MISIEATHCSRLSRIVFLDLCRSKARYGLLPGASTMIGKSTFVGKRCLSTNIPPSASVYELQDQASGDSDEEDEEPFRQPWKSILEGPARASWRVSDTSPPEHISQVYDRLIGASNRTSKQMKRVHQKIVATHSALAEFRERERRRLVNEINRRGRKTKVAYNPEKYPPVYYGPEQAIATLKHRFFPNYSVAKRVLLEAQALLGRDILRPQRVLDFGVGCGGASAAAMDVFGGSVQWIHGIEPSVSMQECSSQVMESIAAAQGHPLRLTHSSSLSADTGGSFDLVLCTYTACEIPQLEANLAASALLFQKLAPNGVLVFIEPGTPDGFNALRATRNMLLDCCPPSGDESDAPGEQCHIVAPCTHNGSCPMVRHKKNFTKPGKAVIERGRDIVDDRKFDGGQNDDDEFDGEVWDTDDEWDDLEDDGDSVDSYGDDIIEVSSRHGGLVEETDVFNSAFCSFVQTMPGAGSSIKGEKLAYLVIQKRLRSRRNTVDNDSEGGMQTKLLAQVRDADFHMDPDGIARLYEEAKHLEDKLNASSAEGLDLDLLRSDESRHSMGRIIRAPIKKRGHVYIDHCASGKIIRSKVTKSFNKIAPGVYPAARKSRWGGFWPNILEKVYSPEK